MLSIGHAGNKLTLDGLEVDALKLHVISTRDTTRIAYPRQQCPPMVDVIAYAFKGVPTFEDYENYRVDYQFDWLVWLPKYGRLATFDLDRLILLNSRLSMYNGDTVGLRARETPMIRVYNAEHCETPAPFEIRQIESKRIYGDASRAWYAEQDHDYSLLENALRDCATSKRKRLYPVGQICVPA